MNGPKKNGWLYGYNINDPKLIGFFPEVFVIKKEQGINYNSEKNIIKCNFFKYVLLIKIKYFFLFYKLKYLKKKNLNQMFL